MRKFFSAVLLFAFFACANLAAAPELAINKGAKHSWGKLRPNSGPLSTSFILKNTGDETLEILEVKPGCSCTTAPLYKTELKPGDTTRMDVTLTYGHSTGFIHKTIVIKTNEEEKKNTKYIDISVNIEPTLTFFPGQKLSMGVMKVGEETLAKTVMTNTSGKELVISNIKTSPGIVVNLEENMAVPPGGDVVIEAKYTPTSGGPYRGSVSFNTSDPHMPKISLVALGSIHP